MSRQKQQQQQQQPPFLTPGSTAAAATTATTATALQANSSIVGDQLAPLQQRQPVPPSATATTTATATANSGMVMAATHSGMATTNTTSATASVLGLTAPHLLLPSHIQTQQQQQQQQHIMSMTANPMSVDNTSTNQNAVVTPSTSTSTNTNTINNSSNSDNSNAKLQSALAGSSNERSKSNSSTATARRLGRASRAAMASEAANRGGKSSGMKRKANAQGVLSMPPTLPPSAALDGNLKYKLTIVQQPNRARMCGFGEKDRRPIDPPPVIQLKIVNGKDGTEIEPPYITSLVVHASIWSTAGEDVGLVAQPTAVLAGGYSAYQYHQQRSRARTQSTTQSTQSTQSTQQQTQQTHQHTRSDIPPSSPQEMYPPPVSPPRQTSNVMTTIATAAFTPAPHLLSGIVNHPQRTTVQGRRRSGSDVHSSSALSSTSSSSSSSSSSSISSALNNHMQHMTVQQQLQQQPINAQGMMAPRTAAFTAATFQLPSSPIGPQSQQQQPLQTPTMQQTPNMMMMMATTPQMNTTSALSTSSSSGTVGVATPDSSTRMTRQPHARHVTQTPRPVEITHEEASSHQFHRNLIGYTISSAYRLKNHNDELGTFFVFPDISVRAEGAFKLKFVLVDIATGGGHSNVLAEVISSRFQVYSAKKFPGMTDSTLLSKKFASQGIKINIRKPGRYPRSKVTPVNSDDDNDGGGGGGGDGGGGDDDSNAVDNSTFSSTVAASSIAGSASAPALTASRQSINQQMMVAQQAGVLQQNVTIMPFQFAPLVPSQQQQQSQHVQQQQQVGQFTQMPPLGQQQRAFQPQQPHQAGQVLHLPPPPPSASVSIADSTSPEL